MKTRVATIKDFDVLYNLGLNTPELKVSDEEPFMDKDDFRARILDKKHVFLIAEEEDKVVGFICANAKDIDRPLKYKYACLVYVAVLPERRRHGVGNKLYEECSKRLRKIGITHLYGWADAQTSAIQRFLINKGFRKGKECIWMDREL